jgi:DtxR family Mn-dependent transcriptional regulator
MEPSLDSLAGNLNISDNHAARLVNKLSGLGLLEIREEKMRLTSGGKSYALKVIRIHRLWERYLAEETSVPVEDWHNDAEFKEHNITEKEAEDLSALLGNPIYDPHGDPIPSKNGDIPDYTGIQLNSLNENEYAIITHVEDEPKEIYQQITAFGLRRGMQIRVLQKNNIKITFDAEGEEIILALPFAQNITVKKIEDEKLIQSEFETLDSLQMNDEAVVVEISKALIGQQRRRLLDLGIVPGTKIKAVLQGAGKDPTAYLVRETTIALRKSISKWIYIKKEKSNAA